MRDNKPLKTIGELIDGGRQTLGLSPLDREQAKEVAPRWIKRKARVERACRGFYLAKGCGKKIVVGDRFYQSKYRAGLDHAEICLECAARQNIE